MLHATGQTRDQPSRLAPYSVPSQWWLVCVAPVAVACGMLGTEFDAKTCRAEANDSVIVRIPAPVIDAFCEAVCPLTLKGTKRVGINVFGKEVTQEVPWTATVTSPHVTITPDKQTFVAKVVAKSTAAPTVIWSDDVSGTLDVSYDPKRKAIVIRTRDALASIAIGPLKMQVDVSQEIPEFVLQLQAPDVSIPNQSQTIKVAIDPTISFEDNTVVVEGTPTFQTSGRRAKKPAADEK